MKFVTMLGDISCQGASDSVTQAMSKQKKIVHPSEAEDDEPDFGASELPALSWNLLDPADPYRRHHLSVSLSRPLFHMVQETNPRLFNDFNQIYEVKQVRAALLTYLQATVPRGLSLDEKTIDLSDNLHLASYCRAKKVSWSLIFGAFPFNILLRKIEEL